MSLSLVEAYDDDALADVRPTITPDARHAPGYHTTLVASADYKRQLARGVEVAGTGGSTLRYYNELSRVRSVSHSATIGMSARLPGKLQLRLNQVGAYSPSYLSDFFSATDDAGAVSASAPDYVLNDSESFAYRTSSTLRRDLGRSAEVSATADWRYTDYTHETELRRDVDERGIRAEFQRALSRTAGVTMGYRYRTGNFGVGSRTETSEHRADVGVDKSWPFSVSRAARISFRIGGSAMDVPPAALLPASGPKYRLQGNLTGTLQFARGWQATTGVRRGLEYMPALTEPVFVDSFNASIEGLVTRRLDLRVSAASASGESLFTRIGSGSTFDTYTGSARVRFALTRTLAVFGEYLYYFYDFGENTRLAPDIPLTLERDGVRAGITLWVPALGR